MKLHNDVYFLFIQLIIYQGGTRVAVRHDKVIKPLSLQIDSVSFIAGSVAPLPNCKLLDL